MRYTPDRIESMTPAERREALVNNKGRVDDPRYAEDAKYNITLIEGSGLPVAEVELRDGDWQLRQIELIINDPANELAMLSAVQRGEPPLGSIEHLIVAKLGNEYRSSRRDTVHAGDLVAKRLYALHYDKVEGGEKPMPAGSVAKRAATFRKRKGY